MRRPQSSERHPKNKSVEKGVRHDAYRACCAVWSLVGGACALFLLLGIIFFPSPAGANHCGGLGQPACCLNTQGIPPCKDEDQGFALTEVDHACIQDEECVCDGLDGTKPDSGGVSVRARCLPKSGCGGDGQPACLGELVLGCKQGLTEVNGCVGECTGPGGRAYEGTCIQADDPDYFILLSDSNESEVELPEGDNRACGIEGYADLHAHLFAHLGHGGAGLVGEPAWYSDLFDTYLVDFPSAALRPDFGTDADIVTKSGGDPVGVGLGCPNYLRSDNDEFDYNWCGKYLLHGNHAVLLDSIGLDDPVGYGTQDKPRSNMGAPYFNGWLTWTSTTHQQMYQTWLERAWHGGSGLWSCSPSRMKLSAKATRGCAARIARIQWRP